MLNNTRDVSWFVTNITDALNNQVAAIIRTGQLLLQAKEELGHGGFASMFDDGKLKISQRTAQRLMKIAEHPILSNPTHASLLPVSWTTLHEMTKLPERELEQMLQDGKINPDIERKEIDELVKRVRDEGIYFYDRVTQALTMLIPFAKKWPDIDSLPTEIFDEIINGKNSISDTDLDNVSTWVCNLHVAYKKKWPQSEDEDDDWDKLARETEVKLQGKAKMMPGPKMKPRKKKRQGFTKPLH